MEQKGLTRDVLPFTGQRDPQSRERALIADEQQIHTEGEACVPR